jgi:hypothetical protein
MRAIVDKRDGNDVRWQFAPVPARELMSRKDRTLLERSRLRERALSRWEDEGGALVADPQHGCAPGDLAAGVPTLNFADPPLPGEAAG